MKRNTVLSWAVIAGVLAGLPAYAASDAACLQNNRIYSWNVINTRTLIVADRENRKFTVHLSGGCVGLTNMVPAMAFRTWTNLGCLRPGDRVSYRAPVLGPMTCFVQGIEPYVEPPKGQNAKGDKVAIQDDPPG